MSHLSIFLSVFNFLPIVEQNKLIIIRKLILKINYKFNEISEINLNKEKFKELKNKTELQKIKKNLSKELKIQNDKIKKRSNTHYKLKLYQIFRDAINVHFNLNIRRIVKIRKEKKENEKKERELMSKEDKKKK